MTGPPPLGPGYMTGTKRQLVLGHGPAPAAPRYTRRRERGTVYFQFTGGRGSRARPGGYMASSVNRRTTEFGKILLLPKRIFRGAVDRFAFGCVGGIRHTASADDCRRRIRGAGVRGVEQ